MFCFLFCFFVFINRLYLFIILHRGIIKQEELTPFPVWYFGFEDWMRPCWRLYHARWDGSDLTAKTLGCCSPCYLALTLISWELVLLNGARPFYKCLILLRWMTMLLVSIDYKAAKKLTKLSCWILQVLSSLKWVGKVWDEFLICQLWFSYLWWLYKLNHELWES